MVVTSKLNRLAGLVDQLTLALEAGGLSRCERTAAGAEVRALISLLRGRRDPGALALSRALSRLGEALLAQPPLRRRNADSQNLRRRFMRNLRRVALAAAAALATTALPFAAAAETPDPVPPVAAIPVVSVGDPIVNPETGVSETIVEVTGDGTVVTNAGNLIILANEIGDVFTVTDDLGGSITYTVTGVTLGAEGRVIGVSVVDGLGAASALNAVTDISHLLDGVPDFPPGDDGTGDSAITFPSASGDVGQYANARRGSNGSDGRDGAGIKTCIPGLGCATVGKAPTSGGNGAAGPNITANVGPGTITTVSDGLAGVVVSSIGGDGGDGGDGWGNLAGARGGRAGRGGDVVVNVAATIVTSGDGSHGVFAQSRSGRGGDGGTGYIAGSGGGGGSPGQGGNVTVNFTGALSTSGRESIGVLAQSLGGAAGGGGDSYGIIGDGGGGTSGGNGGAVTVNQGGVIQTSGQSAHGVLAQSIGGSGGRAGDSGGIATFGDDGGAGGDGGSVHVTARTGSETRTSGEGAFGLFAQSVGGGGGDGGAASGGWTMGSGGAAGGDGGRVEVDIETGAVVATTGLDSHGVFAQSVGGGGGSGGRTSGAVALGASGDAGGGADDVRITSDGHVATEGDNARGLFAQSVGGGGGASRRAGGAVSIGGDGGAGGEGGEVEVEILANGVVTTLGDNADGVFAQSVGGGGGSAQGAVGAVALGGGGGAGGAGGTVDVANAGFIRTEGAQSRGIFAQSVGGGGGQGGGTGGLVSLGGSGGGASRGGDVSVINTGAVVTAGNLSSAIHAQSVGGGGGDGGGSMGSGVTIGGRGGGGGAGGHVVVEHGGQLFTSGADAHGIFAQSVGGGGGSAGYAYQSFAPFGGASLGGAGGDGGDGGRVDVNFTARNVVLPTGTVQRPASIVTEGDRSRGVFAQSVGGGGGIGGYAVQSSGGYGASAAIALGGSGGDGGRGGRVGVTGEVDILTRGDNAEGIFAQSVGGGGGAGGFAVSFALSIGETLSGAFAVGLGGSGGDGGDGGLVVVDAGGVIVTEGQFSTGLLAQSTGGGGGAGGFSVAVTGTASGGASGAVSVGVGGSGGGGGRGGVVEARFDGIIETYGDDAGGALIQSVGGGGGRGGFAVTSALAASGGSGFGASIGVGGSGGDGGDGGDVTGHILGTVHTEGDRASGVIVQSQGGGGGAGGFAVTGAIGAGGSGSGVVSVGVGGSGGDGGRGGTVDASVGSITTLGDQSLGFLAQSVGGGGGAGGFAVSGGISASGGLSGAVSVGVGGSGGGGGDGGDVTARVAGDVVTFGEGADAIVAQSLGGGGGHGGFSVAGGIAASKSAAGAVNVGVGGAGGDGGDGGDVSLDVTGLTQTAGDRSHAILAQSSGGGGGAGGFAVTGSIAAAGAGAGSVNVGIGGAGGGGGHAGGVALTVNAGVTDADDTLIAAVTTGDQSHAIIAQSQGGGGGVGGFSVAAGISAAKTVAGNAGVGVGGSGGDGGDGGDVSLDVVGDVRTAGAGSGAVLAQSGGGGGGAGGFNVTGGIGLSTTASGNLLAGVGGSGGLGGDGGVVTARLDGDVLTLGHESFGVTYQSTGGGGGHGAFNVTGGISLALGGSGGSGVLGVGVGGFGGGGGDGGAVDGTVIGDVTTLGRAAHGVLIQSTGGGGGHGAFNVTGGLSLSTGGSGVAGFGLGGFGGGGGDGGRVTALLQGDVATEGDDAFGALVQSTGGAGGAGAFNLTGGLSLNASNSASLTGAVGVGGFGGDGGDAGDVAADITGAYHTFGGQAFGVTVQSVGGGGGAGGFNIAGGLSFNLGSSGAASVGIGGFGGGGGSAGDVSLVRLGDTVTRGVGSDAILVQSVGNGGGSGGVNINGSVAIGVSGNAGSLALGLGGFGGDGGDAGAVTAHVRGDALALGEDSNGLVVQSLGGGGGAGGINITGALSISQPSGTGMNSGAAVLGVGGFGGAGGNAGRVELTLSSDDDERAQVSAFGDERAAVIVQSVGGGGGAGGINVSGAVALDGVLSTGVGGFGGDGGFAEAVTAHVDADLFASGTHSRGLMVQSVGGGGGHGGMNFSGGVSAHSGASSATVVFGLGGFGGAGARSGDVTVAHVGDIQVEGAQSIGVLVQSVAGGGGSGALNIAGALSQAGLSGYAVAVGVGGDGGDGADAGDVSFDSVGHVIVQGAAARYQNPDDDLFDPAVFEGRSPGIIVQSIGGGGGVGGASGTGVLALSSQPFVAGVGGSGGSGGHGGDVTVRRGYLDVADVETPTAGLIHTTDNQSTGLFVQSVGGGGGQAGMNFAFAASTGAAPGQSPFAALITVGGDGGGAGEGGDVDVRHYGDILTEGDDSLGLFAQSVGGGGGDANLSLGLGLVRRATALNLSVGGAPGAAGRGGDVSVDHEGVIVTSGDRSTALMAQSVGGGGGNAAMSMAMGLFSNNHFRLGLGREGGSGGEGGDVEVRLNGHLDTTGDDSHGVFAQSIGGGGGVSGSFSIGAQGTGNDWQTGANIGTSVGLEGGDSATGGQVTVTAEGSITTRGDRARGIVAQSVGGGGGTGGSVLSGFLRLSGTPAYGAVNVGGAGGTGALGGQVDVVTAATLFTEGDDSDGVLAQSIGGGGGLGGYAAAVSLLAGSVPSGSTTYTGVVNVGGTGGDGGAGGTVEVENTGLILTRGDRSFGVRAQSIGGGGGVGGAVINAHVQTERQSQNYNLNIGGSGGSGADGGGVSILNEGFVVTYGRDASALAAASIGGGGGDAGIVLDMLVGVGGTEGGVTRAVMNIGGSGGTGGDGGDVSVINRSAGAENSGVLATLGDHAHGVLAQSIGGGGGNGSTVLSLTDVAAPSDSLVFGVNLGGSGGDGGRGGLVMVDNSGLIDTSGAHAYGVLAQSIGGGGGNAGMALAFAALLGPDAGTATVAALGGVGGAGGDGGDVTVNNSGRIITRGALAHGIVAQSIGGGGGNAAMGIGFGLGSGALRPALSGTLLHTLGASFSTGAGGRGGEVTVNHSGDITVLGAGAAAIKAESINGGGGSLAVDFSGVVGLPGVPFVGVNGEPERPAPLVQARLGGESLTDMNAGRVTVNATGTFGAGGDHGAAGLIQAIGGGGGSLHLEADIGGDDQDQYEDDPAPVDVDIDLGGRNGTGNAGGDIDSRHEGETVTTGVDAPGALVQSIGGGGGRAVVDLAFGEGGLLGGLSVGLGGSGGVDETGGQVLREQIGAVTTTADLAAGAILQSIGGGGGSASVTVTGATGAGLTAVLGADNGHGLDGGDVTARFEGGVQTQGDHAPALLLQSIGAGGGELRALGVDEFDITLGGANGAYGSGGDINLANTGTIQTTGAGAHGVVLQSIGGGGGAAFGAMSTARVTLSGGNGGDGGDIAFHQTGDIIALGAGAQGLIVQSLGGGGGWVDGAFAGTAGGAGAGGDIAVTLDGQVYAPDADSVAVFLQSQGADGAGDIAVTAGALIRGGAAGLKIDGGADNRIDLSGSLSAVSGLALSATGGNDHVVNDGLVVGNIDLGGGVNSFHNRTGATYLAFGSIVIEGVSATPVAPETAPLVQPGGEETVIARSGPKSDDEAPSDDPQVLPGEGAAVEDAAPLVLPAEPLVVLAAALKPSGDVAEDVDAPLVLPTEPMIVFVDGSLDDADLAPAAPAVAGAFVNDGDFLMGLSASRLPIDLAAGETFGDLDHLGAPETNLYYGARVITTVDLVGSFIQGDQGRMVFDVAFGPYASDRVNVTGDAIVSGVGDITLTWLENADPVTLFATGGAGVDQGMRINDTLAMDYRLIADAAGVHLAFDSDFGQPFLTPNGQALGGHVDSALLAGGSGGVGRLAAMLGNLQAGEEALYASIFDQLNPEAHLAPLQIQLDAAQDFSGRIFGCPITTVRPGAYCTWGAVSVVEVTREGDAQYLGSENRASRLVTGVQRPLNDNWAAAFSLGYEQIGRLRVDGGAAMGKGAGLNLGAGLNYIASQGGLTASAALAAGWRAFDMQRLSSVFTTGVGASEFETAYVQANGRVAWSGESGRLFATPALNLSITGLRHMGFAETGLGGLGASGDADTQWLVTVNPELTAGVVLQQGHGSRATLSLTYGLSWRSEDALTLPMRLIGSNPDAAPALLRSPIDQEQHRLGVSLELAHEDRVSIRFDYESRQGDRTESHSASAGVRIRF